MKHKKKSMKMFKRGERPLPIPVLVCAEELKERSVSHSQGRAILCPAKLPWFGSGSLEWWSGWVFFSSFFCLFGFFFVFNQQQFLLWDEIGWAPECLDFIIIVCIFIRMEFMKEISNFWKVITIIIIFFF